MLFAPSLMSCLQLQGENVGLWMPVSTPPPAFLRDAQTAELADDTTFWVTGGRAVPGDASELKIVHGRFMGHALVLNGRL